MDSVKQQVIERIKQANNILVTVSNNPSVDQLAACIGLTLMLNKLGKHGTAVFSGQVPSTIEFLQPEKTLEKTTDSLRDFIIALDKSKADKLRYKVEDKVVKIFITPYKTSISEKDLQFSEGDFNVDVVIALGVHNQAELDQAIAAHGRILHDATVISINDTANGSLGTLNLLDQTTSSLSELVADLDGQIGKPTLDAQIATALLTGIVAETERFSNAKTSSQTMGVSSKLMSAGANQQLVATKLAPPPPPPPKVSDNGQAPPAGKGGQPAPTPTGGDSSTKQPAADGAIQINHEEKPQPTPSDEPEADAASQISIDQEGTLRTEDTNGPPATTQPGVNNGPSFVLQPPTMGGTLTASSEPDSFDQGREPTADPLSLPPTESPMLNREPLGSVAPPASSPLSPSSQPAAGPPTPPANLDNARDAVEAAIDSAPPSELPPIKSLNAQPVFDTHDDNFAAANYEEQPSGAPPADRPQLIGQPPAGAPTTTDDPLNTLDMPMPSGVPPTNQPAVDPNGSQQDAAAAPPPVPPPMMPFPPAPGSNPPQQ